MTQLLVRNIDIKTLDSLKNRAKLNHRSLQGEIKTILEDAANTSTLHRASWSPDVIKRIVGGWSGDDLTRPSQSDYEQRDEFE